MSYVLRDTESHQRVMEAFETSDKRSENVMMGLWEREVSFSWKIFEIDVVFSRIDSWRMRELCI